LNSVSRFLTKHNVTVLPHPPYSPDLSPCDFFSVSTTEKRLKGRRHENIEAKRLRRRSSQAFRKRHSLAAFKTCRNAGNSVLTAGGTTSKGTGSISYEVEFCIFYRLSLRTLRTKDVISKVRILLNRLMTFYSSHFCKCRSYTSRMREDTHTHSHTHTHTHTHTQSKTKTEQRTFHIILIVIQMKGNTYLT
jgi:ABC-type nickel/cobalt efflux system permease component RcnA